MNGFLTHKTLLRLFLYETLNIIQDDLLTCVRATERQLYIFELNILGMADIGTPGG